jgi:hypothetical protein
MNFRTIVPVIAAASLFPYGKLLYKTKPNSLSQVGKDIFNHQKQAFTRTLNTFQDCLDKEGFYLSTAVSPKLESIGRAYDQGIRKPAILNYCYRDTYRKMTLPGFLVKPSEYLSDFLYINFKIVPAIERGLRRIWAFGGFARP